MRAVITVIGRNKIGIVAGITQKCSDNKMDIVSLEQQIMQGIFTMMILVDLSEVTRDLSDIADDFLHYGEERGLEVRVRHEDTFNVMYELDRK